jgi:hypothetical protein
MLWQSEWLKVCKEFCMTHLIRVHKTVNCFPDAYLFKQTVNRLDTPPPNPLSLPLQPTDLQMEPNHHFSSPHVGQRTQTKSGDSFPRIPCELNYIRRHSPRPQRRLLDFAHRRDAAQPLSSQRLDVIENHLVLVSEDEDTNIMTSYMAQEQLQPKPSNTRDGVGGRNKLPLKEK